MLMNPTHVPVGTTRQLIREGAHDMTPMLLGVLPLAIAIGAAFGSSSLSLLHGIASGPLTLSGAAQLNTVELLETGAAVPVVVGAATCLVAGFTATQALAVATASRAPAGLGLQYAAPLALVGLVAKAEFTASTVGTTIAAGLAAVWLSGMPLQLGLILAIVSGIAVGTVVGRVQS